MTAVTPAAKEIQVEQVGFRKPASESTLSQMAASINYSLQRNAQILEINGEGIHVLGRRGTVWQPLHYIRKKSKINTYILTNNVNGSADAIRINAEIYDESGVSLGNLFSVAPEINSAIASAGSSGRYSVGRYVEDSQDINAGTNKVVGTLNFTELQEGYFLRFFVEEVQVDGAGYHFKIWLRETS